MPEDKTFSAYNEQQGQAYAQSRLDYHHTVYSAVINQHTSTGGKLDTLVDVGCGPGIAARALAPRFVHAFGLDHSNGMIESARKLGGVTSTSEPVRFEVSSAEELGSNLSPPIPEGSVDLITAATAAHWFDMDVFWARAAKMLKPGGSIAIWVCGDVRAHPSNPNADALQAAIERNREEYLNAFYLPGNRMSLDQYADLPLPWDLAQPVAELDQSTFYRREWKGGEDFFAVRPEMDMDGVEKLMATTSPVTRWREAHPDAVGTEKDVARVLRREIEELLRSAGVEAGKEKLLGETTGALLIVKKKAL
ncbi:hypothetical protein ACJ41O_007403 [Fusarium nematophilum]